MKVVSFLLFTLCSLGSAHRLMDINYETDGSSAGKLAAAEGPDMSPDIQNFRFPVQSEPNIIMWSIQCYKETEGDYGDWSKCIRRKCSKTWPKKNYQVVAGKIGDSPVSFYQFASNFWTHLALNRFLST